MSLIITKTVQVLKSFLAHPRIFLEGLLVAAIVVTGWLYNKKSQELLDARAEYGQLADNLREQITIRNNEIEVLKRGADGKVKREVVYVPPEGWYRIVTPLDGSKPSVVVKDKGFTLKPGFGGVYGSYGFSGVLDVKLAYFKRYSAGVNGNTHMAGVFISRHIDDIMWGRPANVEPFIGYALIKRLDVSPLSIGIRANF